MHNVNASRHTPCAIIGSGPAGYTAAIYAARALLHPVVVTGIQPGGQLTVTTEVENFPGFPKSILGPQLMEDMREQARKMGAEILDDSVVGVDLSRRPFPLTLDSGGRLLAETLIVATGAQARWLGLQSETVYQGFGVSACATCDGFFHRDKPVVVVGGGNTALEEALFLTTFASRVTLIHRRGEFRAEQILQDRVLANPKINVRLDSVLEEVLGADNPRGVNAVRIHDLRTGSSALLDCHGVFIAIGHSPASAIFAGQLETDAAGYVKVRPGTATTSVAGVFAAGDVADPVYRQAVTAASMGCIAALDAVRLLNEERHHRSHRGVAA